jgi:LPS-assembly lipoprotein
MSAQRNLHWLAPLLLALTLTGCGFQLRGTVGKIGPELSPIYLQGPDPYGPFMSQVRSGLRAAGAHVVDQPQQARAILHVDRADYSRRDVALGGSSQAPGQVREYGLTLIVEFHVNGPKGATLRPRQRIVVQRDYTFDVTAALGKGDEEALLREDMYRDAADQLLWRLELG